MTDLASEHPQLPRGLGDHLQAMQELLLSHMKKEEQVLFPMLLRGGHPLASGPITMMRSEHDEHVLALQRLGDLTHAHTPPDQACNTGRALYLGTRQLNDDLAAHIHLENEQLFSAFEARSAHAP